MQSEKFAKKVATTKNMPWLQKNAKKMFFTHTLAFTSYNTIYYFIASGQRIVKNV